MFIKRGSHVEIKATGYDGCFGVVREVVWDDSSFETMAFVEFWHGVDGRFYTLFFRPQELVRRVISRALREQIELMAAAQQLEGAAA